MRKKSTTTRPRLWFRALLMLFPAEFRVDHRRGMEQVFRDQVHDARAEGRAGVVRLWAGTLWGTLATAPSEHLRILRQDVAYASRRVCKRPGLALVAVLAISLGIGATAAVFSLVNQVLLRPLPYREPQRLVHLRPLLDGEDSISGPIYLELVRETSSFAGLFTMAGLGSTTISGEEGPERVRRLIVSPNYFEVLGRKPLVGRGFAPQDQVFLPPDVIRGAAPEELPVSPVVISHDLWQRRFAGAADTVGQLLKIDGRPFEIIGILPPDFRVWTPRRLNLSAKRDLWYLSSWDPGLFPRDVYYLAVMGRLKRGVTLAQAQAEIDAFCARQRERHPMVRDVDYRIRLEPLHAQVVSGTVRPLWLLFGAVILVLMIACSNVAGLMLAGGATRQGELGLRVALGASRERLVRLLMTETFLLAAAGAVLGLALAYFGLDLLASFRPESLQRFEEVRIDGAMLAFALVATTVSALLFGTVPSLRYSRPNLESALASGRRPLGSLLRQRKRGLLVASQIALSFVLMAGTGLLLRSFAAQRAVDPGFEPEGVTTTSVHFPYRAYREPEDRLALLRAISDKVSAIPGVESVGLTSAIPFDSAGGHIPIATDREPDNERMVWDAQVTPGYFRTMGLRLRSGRFPEWHDFIDPERPFALVDEALAERLWPGENAVGRLVRVSRLNFESNEEVPNEQAWAEVIGVVGSIRDGSLAAAGPETFYLGMNFVPRTSPILAIKSAGEPAALAPAVRETLRRIHEEVATSAFTDMDEWIAESTADLRFTMALLGLFGAIGLALAAIGLYALLAHSVRRGTGEIGLRMALGAECRGIFRVVLSQGMKPTLVGLALGVLGSSFFDRLLVGFLFGVGAHDLGTLGGVASVLLATAVLACGVPALRAMRVDPMTALRTE